MVDSVDWNQGETHRTSSWAAKIRCSLPTIRVTMEGVRLLCGADQVSIPACVGRVSVEFFATYLLGNVVVASLVELMVPARRRDPSWRFLETPEGPLLNEALRPFVAGFCVLEKLLLEEGGYSVLRPNMLAVEICLTGWSRLKNGRRRREKRLVGADGFVQAGCNKNDCGRWQAGRWKKKTEDIKNNGILGPTWVSADARRWRRKQPWASPSFKYLPADPCNPSMAAFISGNHAPVGDAVVGFTRSGSTFLY
jgi:hypothetical protein